MITLTCTQCKAQLEMDDAFAGGVCRCQHCGTIQTVPSHLKGAVAAHAGSKALYQNPSRGAAGLDDLADVVASSGLARSGLTGPASGAATRAPAPPVDYARPAQQKKNRTPLIVAGAAAAGVLALLLFLFVGRSSGPVVVKGGGGPGTGTRPGTGTVIPGGTNPGGGPDNVAVPSGPHFVGINLGDASSVIYVLDRGQATAELFDTLKAATYSSLQTLTPGRKFQVIFWSDGSQEAAYPESGLASATAQEIEAAEKRFEDVVASGNTSPATALEKAAASRPSAIVLATGKGLYLDEETAGLVDQALKGAPIKVHTVALGADDGNSVLNGIAQKSGGEYRVVNERQLDGFTR